MQKWMKWLIGTTAVVAAAGALLLVRRPVPADACGSRNVIQANLRLAAERRPVSDWVIYTDREQPWQDETTANEGTINSLRDLTGRTPEQLGQMHAERRLSYALEAGNVTVTWTNGPFAKEPLVIDSIYRFPNGSVPVGDEISSVIAELKAAHAAGQVRYFTVTRYRSAMDEWENTDYYWGTLKNAIKAFGNGKEAFPCVPITLAIAGDDFAAPLTLPMLEVGRGRYVGFYEEKIITYNTFEGLSSEWATTRWYPFPARP